MTSRDLSSLFQGDPSAPTPGSIRQGVVEAWDPDTGENSIQIAGGTLVNVPSLTAESAELVAGDVVAVWTSEDRALVLGKVTTPGDPGTVPTWNEDLSALAPLADLAAVTTGLTVTGAVNVTTPDPGTGAHVVVNDPAYPGQIALYSGNASEVDPGLIMPVLGGANYGKLEVRSPDLVGTAQYSFLELDGFDDGTTTATLQANDVEIVSGGNVRLTGNPVEIGDGSDFVTITGHVVTDADLSSTTNTFPTYPFFYGYLNANQSIPNNTATTVTGWVADGSPHNSGITHAAGVFTVPIAGRYRLRAQTWWSLIAAPAGARTAQWRLSPGTTLASDTTPPSSVAATPNFVEKTIRLAASAQVFLQVQQVQGAAVNLVGTSADITYAQIEWVGP